MHASLAHSIALEQAAKPILAMIKKATMNGNFGIVFTCQELPVELRKHLEHLEYRVELGGSGLMYYVFW